MTDEEKLEYQWSHDFLVASVKKVIVQDRKFKAWMREAHKHSPERVGEIIKRIMMDLNE